MSGTGERNDTYFSFAIFLEDYNLGDQSSAISVGTPEAGEAAGRASQESAVGCKEPAEPAERPCGREKGGRSEGEPSRGLAAGSGFQVSPECLAS